MQMHKSVRAPNCMHCTDLVNIFDNKWIRIGSWQKVPCYYRVEVEPYDENIQRSVLLFIQFRFDYIGMLCAALWSKGMILHLAKHKLGSCACKSSWSNLQLRSL